MSNALTKIQSNEKPKWLAIDQLDELRKRGAHVLVPAQYQAQVSPYWQGVCEIVFLSPDPDDKDVWKLPGGAKLGLSKVGLLKICRAAGIELYNAVQQERTPGYIRYEGTVRKRNTSGAWEYFRDTKSLDRANLLENETASAIAKIGSKYGAKTAEEATAKAEENIRRIWQFHEERCATGAYLRALRSVLGIRGDYTPQDLTKPFIVQAVHFSPDESQPELRQMMQNAAKLTAVQLWSNTPDERTALEQRTGQTIGQLEQQQEQVALLRAGENASGPDGPQEPDELDAAIAAVRGALPLSEPLDYQDYDEEDQ